MIRERCSCGATFETSGASWVGTESTAAKEWRTTHKCHEPVALAEIHDSGPGLADVIERLESIAERVSFIGRLMVQNETATRSFTVDTP